MILDLIKSLIYGIVEGVTEWLPVSSTGHMILLNSFLHFHNVSDGFFSMFEVVIQFGAILAVVALYWRRLWPWRRKDGKVVTRRSTLRLWCKIIIACIPAAIVGVLFDDKIEELFYHPVPIALALIIVGVVFILVENHLSGSDPAVTRPSQISARSALIIGMFQLAAAIFPGTSRSGATIIGALLIGIARPAAAEFTFYLAVPVMLGASLLKIVRFGLGFTGAEVAILLVGMISAFVVSVFIIRFLMSYIRRHDFKVFGWYRIVLGVFVLIAAATFMR
ncbi:MAG: undecaprenyl-diphosphate phosphatase [Lachnospira sp.]|nr:undecaprenyl-diphosphate phosphatase [Lachnospira sp.]